MILEFAKIGFGRLASMASIAIVLAMSSAAIAQDLKQPSWSQFLGAAGNSEALDSAKLPTSWDESKYKWQTEITGTGWSSPVFAEGRIWITTAVTAPATKEQIKEKTKDVQFADMKTTVGSLTLLAVCLDLESGEILKEIELAKVDDPGIVHPLNSFASPTPAISDGKVICHFGNYGTWCLDAESGEEIWKTKFVVDHSVGAGSSPVVHNGKVILVCDGIDQQFIAAVNLSDGEQLWKTDRPEFRNPNVEMQKAYSTPLIAELAGKTQAIIPGAQWLISYDPDTGNEFWRVDHGGGFSVTPMATIENDIVIFATGFMQSEFVAVDPTGSGDVTKSHVNWRSRKAPTMPSMVSSEGKVFAVTDDGIMVCLDADSGEVLHRRRVKGNYSATPLLAGGNLYVSSREGLVTILKGDETLADVGKQQFEGRLMATPAPVGNDILIRTSKKLYRISGDSK